MSDGGCSICGAEPVVARGWCRLHYKRWWRTGDPQTTSTQAANKGLTCSVTGCLRPAVTKKMCKMHDKRRRKGNVGPATRLRAARTDDLCFCGLPAVADGHCAAHQ